MVCGVYAIGDNNAIVLRNTISTGNVGESSVLKIGAIYRDSVQNKFYVGWQDGSSFGVDVLSTTGTLYTNNEAYFESPLFQVGTTLKGKQFQDIEFKLGKKLQSGQEVKIKYRTDLSDDWTTIGTYDFATLGAVREHIDTAGIPETSQVQIRVELTQDTSNKTDNIELIEVRLR